MRNFNDLLEREILALAISLEEDDERIYGDFAEGLRENFAASASVFESMQMEEASHRHRLIELYRLKFGERRLSFPIERGSSQDRRLYVKGGLWWHARWPVSACRIAPKLVISEGGKPHHWRCPELFVATDIVAAHPRTWIGTG